MSATGAVDMICDGCGDGWCVDLVGPEVLGGLGPRTIEDAVEAEGWSWHGTLLDRLLCDDCAEREGDDG